MTAHVLVCPKVVQEIGHKRSCSIEILLKLKTNALLFLLKRQQQWYELNEHYDQ